MAILLTLGVVVGAVVLTVVLDRFGLVDVVFLVMGISVALVLAVACFGFAVGVALSAPASSAPAAAYLFALVPVFLGVSFLRLVVDGDDF